jgi:aldose 1-epimerase
MRLFGKLKDGREVYEYTLKNNNGIQVKVINYGGIITSVVTPDKDGNFGDIVAGFDTLEEYVNDEASFGALVGRYANRIGHASFLLGEEKFSLPVNNGPNCLHGGKRGFNKVFWEIIQNEDNNNLSLLLKYLSTDGEEGFPGNLSVEVKYTLRNDNSLEINYSARTDKKTVFNPTQHSYFNLSGGRSIDILHHRLQINAQEYLPTDIYQIPLGPPKNVKKTPFDFTNLKHVGKDISKKNEQLNIGNGYDHSWILKYENSDELVHAATLIDDFTGRQMDVFTTEPGIQLYTGNYIDNLRGKNGIIYCKNYSLALETQHFPDSPNKPQFPTTVLDVNKEFASSTIYKFSLINQ